MKQGHKLLNQVLELLLIMLNLLGNIFAVYAQIPFRAHVVEGHSGEKRERTKTGELTLCGGQNWENNQSKKRLTGRTRG